MSRMGGYALAVLLGLFIGYFAGREHLKYEMRTAFSSAISKVQSSFGATSGEGQDAEDTSSKPPGGEDRQEDLEESRYIAENMQLYDIEAGYREAVLDGRVPGVRFKLKNSGKRSLSRVEVTFYFHDADGNVIAEETFLPVRVSSYFSADNHKPLKPGYIWQMEERKFYAAKRVPSEWLEGRIKAEISDIEFAEVGA